MFGHRSHFACSFIFSATGSCGVYGSIMQLLFKFQAEINDKTFILEQLDSEYDALQILEATQVETIEYLTQLR